MVYFIGGWVLSHKALRYMWWLSALLVVHTQEVVVYEVQTHLRFLHKLSFTLSHWWHWKEKIAFNSEDKNDLKSPQKEAEDRAGSKF